jgi:hypothetical protein
MALITARQGVVKSLEYFVVRLPHPGCLGPDSRSLAVGRR